MTSIERVQSVLEGRLPDRPPFGFWYHFKNDQISGNPAVHAHLDQLAAFGMDFLKVMNDNMYPHVQRIRDVTDLASLTPIHGDEHGFGRQLELISALRKELGGRVYLSTTLFNAWMMLRLLVEPPEHHYPPNLDAAADGPSRWIREAYEKNPQAVAQAIRVIGSGLAKFAAMCLRAGADGVFLSVRDDWVDVSPHGELYNQIVRPTDLEILDAVRDAKFNILHVCGKAADFQAFGQYPAAVVHWADRAAGPSIASVKDWLKPAICAGVDNLGTLVSGKPMDVVREVMDAVRQAGGRPIMIAPGCTFDPDRVSRSNLEAIGRAARECRYGS